MSNYGAIKAIRGISLTVEKGEIVTLIGSNGAGKEHHDEHDDRPGKGCQRQHRFQGRGYHKY